MKHIRWSSTSAARARRRSRRRPRSSSVGDLDPRTFRPGMELSRKLQKAMSLAEAGQQIEIWTEGELHERLAVGPGGTGGGYSCPSVPRPVPGGCPDTWSSRRGLRTASSCVHLLAPCRAASPGGTTLGGYPLPPMRRGVRRR